jgi:hypothetical protein
MSDLERHISSLIEEKTAPLQKEISELKEQISSIGEKEYYSADEITKKYSISRTTLWRLHKNNHINKYLVEGKTLYKKSEIDKVIQVC